MMSKYLISSRKKRIKKTNQKSLSKKNKSLNLSQKKISQTNALKKKITKPTKNPIKMMKNPANFTIQMKRDKFKLT